MERRGPMTHLALEKVSHHEVVVHRLGDDLGNGLGRHLNIGVVLRRASLHEARSAKCSCRVSVPIVVLSHLAVSCKTKTRNISKLREVFLHLALVESMRDPTDI
jgi:hypothetical protein